MIMIVVRKTKSNLGQTDVTHHQFGVRGEELETFLSQSSMVCKLEVVAGRVAEETEAQKEVERIQGKHPDTQHLNGLIKLILDEQEDQTRTLNESFILITEKIREIQTERLR